MEHSELSLQTVMTHQQTEGAEASTTYLQNLKLQWQVALSKRKLALLPTIWSLSIQNYKVYYNLGSDVSVGEKLFTTKAICSFMQNMTGKPEQFGMKLWLAVDIESYYLLNGFTYFGKNIIVLIINHSLDMLYSDL